MIRPRRRLPAAIRFELEDRLRPLPKDSRVTEADPVMAGDGDQLERPFFFFFFFAFIGFFFVPFAEFLFDRFQLAFELFEVRRLFVGAVQRRHFRHRAEGAVDADLGEAVLAVEREQPDPESFFHHRVVALAARFGGRDLFGFFRDEPHVEAAEGAEPSVDRVRPRPRMKRNRVGGGLGRQITRDLRCGELQPVPVVDAHLDQEPVAPLFDDFLVDRGRGDARCRLGRRRGPGGQEQQDGERPRREDQRDRPCLHAGQFICSRTFRAVSPIASCP